MAKTKLFEAWSFRLQQPAPFDDPKYAGSKSMGFSQYNTSSTAQKSTLHAPTMRALLAYAKLVSATENGQSVDGLGAIGHQGTTYRISEYRSANKTDCVVFNPVTGKFNAAQVEDGTQALKPYSVGAGNGTGSGLLFCLMPVLNEDDEFRQKFQEFVSLLESGWADMDAAFECALTLCDNVYRRIENSKQLGSDGVKISIPTTGNISVITQMAMDSGNYAPTGASYGEFTIMQMSGTPTAKASSFQKEDFVAKYALSNRTLTARELAMVPTLPDWYIIPKEVVRVCEHAKVTTASSQPMRNFLFRGEAGTGKTMGAQAIAAGLNLPYTLMTCSANTEITDLVGQFIPDILVQHRMLLGLWSQPVLRKRSWMRNISGSARAMTRPLMNGQWIATIGDGSCVRFAAELSRMRRCPITVAREVQTGESVPIVHEMVVANPHSWLDIIRMMVYY